MKKQLVVLALALSLSVTGCSKSKTDHKEQEAPTQEVEHKEQETPTEEAEITEQTTPTVAEDDQMDTAKEEQTTELTGILQELKENVQIGTAGSSLGQAKYAAELLDWAMTTSLTEGEVKDAASSWSQSLKEDELTEFKEQLDAVDGAYDELKKDNAQDLLSCAGCEDTAYPWNDTAKSIVDAIMKPILGEARE